MKTFTTLSALAMLAAASPVPGKPTGSTWWSGNNEVVSYVAEFDDVPAAFAGLPVALTGSLGPYDNLYYQNLQTLKPLVAPAGVPPFSAPNAIYYQIEQELSGGPKIYADYDDSITDHFNFKSFYFGCVVATQEAAATTPVSCTITITGFRNNQQVVTQDATFNVNIGTIEQNMEKVVLQGFGDVDAVTFATAAATGTKGTTAVTIDNLEYDVTLKEGKTYSY
ncbi:hypothetical protein MBLNU457_2048t1 [Dothideomycetes sp. NU457]